MKSKFKNLLIITLMTFVLSACGSSSVRQDDSGSVVQQKTERAATTAERRVDQHTDHKVNKAIDKLFRKF